MNTPFGIANLWLEGDAITRFVAIALLLSLIKGGGMPKLIQFRFELAQITQFPIAREQNNPGHN